MNSLWKKALRVFMGTSVLQVSAILNFIILARMFTHEDFANLRQLMLLNQMIFTIVFAATPASLLYFCGKALTLAEKKGIAVKHLIVLLGSLLFTSCLISLNSTIIAASFNNDALAQYLVLFSVLPLSYTLYNSIPTFLVALEKTQHLKWYCPLIATVNTLPVLFVAINGSFNSVLITLIVFSVFSAIIALILLFKLTRAGVSTNTNYHSILNFSWFMVLASAITVTGSKIDQFLISNQLGLTSFAIYAVGAFQIPVYSLIQSSVNSVTLPRFTELLELKDWHQYRQLWSQSVDKIASVALPISAFLTAFSNEFILVVFGDGYEKAGQVFLVFSLIAPVKCISFGLYFRANGLPKYDALGAIFFLVVSSIFAYIGSQYSMLGVSIGVLLSVIVLACFMSTLVWKHSCGEITLFDIIPKRFLFKHLLWLMFFFLVQYIYSIF